MPDASADIVAAKRRLRTEALARRERMDEACRHAAAIRLTDHGLEFLMPPAGAVVSAYCAIGAELDPALLLARLAGEGLSICLPVLTPLGQPLRFRIWRPGDPLVERKWGIREPDAEAPLVEPDILLVPLLAFDSGCRRLGYGGGYYDRTLARLRAQKPITAIGLAYAGQEVAAVPCEAHDVPLDRVLTPQGPRAPAGRVGAA